jgi:hypothetical protein
MGHRGGDACGIARVDRDGSATFAYATARSLPSREVLGMDQSELTARRAGANKGRLSLRSCSSLLHHIRSWSPASHHVLFSGAVVPAMFSVARKSVLRQARTRLRSSQPVTVPQYSALSRSLSTLALLEQKDGKLLNSSLAGITAGTKLGGSITAFVAGSGAKSVAEEAAKVKGIEKIIYVESGAYDRVGLLDIGVVDMY